MTAEKKVRAATSLDSTAQLMPHAGQESSVYRDNSRCTQELADGRSESLTRFVACDRADRVARGVQHDAGSARLAFEVSGLRQAVAK